MKLLFVLAAAFVVMAGGILTLQRLDRDIEELEDTAQETRLRELEAEKQKGDMLQEINNQDTDAYIRENARTQYGYLMPGEIRFEVTNPEALQMATPSPAPTEAAP